MSLEMGKDRLLNEVQTVEKAVSLCEDLPELLDSLAETAGDAERRTAVELYAAALRTLLRSAKDGTILDKELDHVKEIKYEVWILEERWHQKMCVSREEAMMYVEEAFDTAKKIEVIPR